MTWQKAKNITLSRSGENGGCLPSLVASENIILPSSSLMLTELMRPHLLKHTIQNAIVGMKGGHLRKGLRSFSRGLKGETRF